jgi:hypothetical protein
MRVTPPPPQNCALSINTKKSNAVVNGRKREEDVRLVLVGIERLS